MTTIKVLIDLRAQFGAARNQGPRPTCMAFAASDAHAALRGDWLPLSCEYIFYMAQKRHGRPPTLGALLSATLEALCNDGQPEESGWPYLAATPVDPSSWLPPASVGALFGRAGIASAHALDHIIAQLDQGIIQVLLLLLSRAFYNPNKAAVVHPANDEAPEPQRRHAVIAVGHGIIDGHRAILVRNSWGPGWGDAGYGWLTEPFLVPRLYAAATLMEEVDVPAGSIAA